MTVEYWLEAVDNCGVKQPDAKSPPGKPNNIGESSKKKVVLGPPEKAEDRLREQQADQARRKSDEDRARKQQDEKFQTERRDPPAPPQVVAERARPEVDNHESFGGP